ncbi:MAG: hypothetical protein WCT77_10370, partial [Bacteroidota bacterium]
MSLIIKVALPLPVHELFTYSIPEETSVKGLPGRRVLVPLGKRTMTGIIISEETEKPKFEIKPVYEILDEKPVFSSHLLELADWISQYYFCSYGEALKAGLPTGMSPKSLMRIHILKFPNEKELADIKKK